MCPVMLSSSQQASLTGRFGDSEYGRSKKAGEDLFLDYATDTGLKCWSIVSPICLESGVVRTTIPL